MTYENEKIIHCSEFEEVLTDYLDISLDRQTHKAVAAHALRCPLCHALLNEVKEALELCHEISVPKFSMAKLEAGILSNQPEPAMACEDLKTSERFRTAFALWFSDGRHPFMRKMNGLPARLPARLRLLHLQNGRVTESAGYTQICRRHRHDGSRSRQSIWTLQVRNGFAFERSDRVIISAVAMIMHLAVLISPEFP